MRIAFLLLFVSCSVLYAGMLPSDALLQDLETKVDNLMAAYNEQNWREFYANWPRSMAAIISPENFRMIFIDKYKQKFGDYISREMLENATVVDEENSSGTLVYEAVFEKNERVKITIRLVKEDEEWKFKQVDMNPIR